MKKLNKMLSTLRPVKHEDGSVMRLEKEIKVGKSRLKFTAMRDSKLHTHLTLHLHCDCN